MASKMNFNGGLLLTKAELCFLETLIEKAHNYWNETGTSYRDVVVALETILATAGGEDDED